MGPVEKRESRATTRVRCLELPLLEGLTWDDVAEALEACAEEGHSEAIEAAAELGL